jgi:hypothetical protein
MAFRTQHISSYNVGSDLSTVLHQLSARDTQEMEAKARAKVLEKNNDIDYAKLAEKKREFEQLRKDDETTRKQTEQDALEELRAKTLVANTPTSIDYTTTKEVTDTSNVITPAEHTALPEDWKPKGLKEPKLGKMYDIDEKSDTLYKQYIAIKNSDMLPEVKRVKIRGLIDPDKLNEEDGLITKVGKYVAKGAAAIDKGLFTMGDYLTRPIRTPEGIAHDAIELDKAYKAADKAYTIDDPEEDFITQMEDIGNKKKHNDLVKKQYDKAVKDYKVKYDKAYSEAVKSTPMTKPVYGTKTLSVLNDDKKAIIAQANKIFSDKVAEIKASGLSEKNQLRAILDATKKRDSLINNYDSLVAKRANKLEELSKETRKSNLTIKENRDKITYKALTEAKTAKVKADIDLQKLLKEQEIKGSSPALEHKIKLAELAKTKADTEYKKVQTTTAKDKL